jgi:hypothetical protein
LLSLACEESVFGAGLLNQSAAVRATRFSNATSTKERIMFKWINSPRSSAEAMFIIVVALATFGFSGCERKEKVVDIETPGVDVEVERDVDTGEVEVKTSRE